MFCVSGADISSVEVWWMKWSCKFCSFATYNEKTIVNHYKDSHGRGRRGFSCIYPNCLTVFQTHVDFAQHLKEHKKGSNPVAKIRCELCAFSAPTNIKQYFLHLKRHLRNRETVNCPFAGCSFKSRVFSTFTAHKSRYHCTSKFQDFRPDLVINCHSYASVNDEQDDLNDSESQDLLLPEPEFQPLQKSVQRRIGSLLLRLQAVLHVSQSAIQEIVDDLFDIGVCAGQTTRQVIESILQVHNCTSEELTSSLTEAVQNANALNFLSREGPLGTEHKRQLFYRQNFTVIEPVEYVLSTQERTHTVVYVPILKLLPEVLKREEVLQVLGVSKPIEQSGHYRSFRDGDYFKENEILSGKDVSLSITLYIDDFEICNPLGTSRKKHKVCGVYWILANLPARYKSSLSSIYLALLCKSEHIKIYGYNRVLEPLIKDIQYLETVGVFVEKLACNVKGTILHVASDNLAAHSLGGFQESFNVEKFCRFCMVSREDIQTCDVRSGNFVLRSPELYDNAVNLLKQSELLSVDGVKQECPLNRLKGFHACKGFPPDFLHDLLEGIVPVELSLCLDYFISKKYFTLEEINSEIQGFPFKFSDKTNRPQKVPSTFQRNNTLRGNGHENWSLVHFLPLIIGHRVPEGDQVWELVLELKDLVELLSTSHFTSDSLCCLQSKISDHRQLLLTVFPQNKLRPKHHFIEHYPYLIQKFGPLIECWTIRFEAKHSFFKKVVRDANNFKNILLTLASRHQLMLAHYFDMPSIFKPEIAKVSDVCLEVLDSGVRQAILNRFSDVDTVGLTPHTFLNGTKYSKGMILSAGSTSGLPDFGRILEICIVLTTHVCFIIEPFMAYYVEHLRSYHLVKKSPTKCLLVKLEDLNDYVPLVSYLIQGRLLVTPRTFLLK